jgi:hypothetical protein
MHGVGEKTVEAWIEDHDETSVCWTIEVDGEVVSWWIEETTQTT